MVRPENPAHLPAFTKAVMLDNINLMENHIELNNVRDISNGSILLPSESDTDAFKFYHMTKGKLNGNYEVIELQWADPQVRIVGLSASIFHSTP